MSWISRVIDWLLPSRREGGDIGTRHYDAGDYSRLNANWRTINQSAEYTDRYSRDAVRARARDLERNSDMATSIVGAFVRNTVGGGFSLQAETGSQEKNQELETLWKQWCKKQNCDVTGTQCFNQMLRMAVRRKKVDGGMLFVKRYTESGILPFKLQMFEVDELDSSQMAPKRQGNRVVGGIEYNPYNRPEGYWIRQFSIDGIMAVEPVYIEAKDVIFYFSKRRASQLREMSDLSQTVTRIRDINEFMIATATKQRMEACIGLAIYREIPTVGVLPQRQANPKRKSYDGKRMSPGMMLELNEGDKISVISPQGQAADATSYLKLQQHLIASGQGVSFEAIARDMSESTYSSARQGLIEDGMTYAEEGELLMEVMDEVYETFVISAVLAGKITAPDFWQDKQKYFAHSWVKPPKPWIDPAKEAAATKIALQTGQKTFKQLAAENGSDWQTQVDDIAEVLKYARDKHQIDLGGVILGQKTNGLYTDEPERDSASPDAGSGNGKNGIPSPAKSNDTDKGNGTEE
ncbi:MAG: phage portal protein [Oscillospiraceae bacterium]|nr:phage portal protein [Oscillospiraceae bacterium]